METTAVIVLVIGLVMGLAVGAGTAWLVLRSRAQTTTAEDESQAARVREDLAAAQAQAAEARAQAADARAEAAHSRSESAKQETAVAQARVAAAEAQAEAAEVSARLAAAIAERDAARTQLHQLSEDRESLANQFKVLSAEALERQGKTVDASTAQRLEQTKAALEPLTNLMTQFSNRLTEIEKERVAISTDLRTQVQVVQQTGEHLRHETRALSTALRKPQVRGHWGEVQLKRVAEYAGMVERCDFELQPTTQTSADRTIRPDMRVNLPDSKYLFVDSKVPLSAFLEAYETEDEQIRSDRLTQFGRNVRSHVEQLSGKQYWKADAGTPEFVVLFLPNEQFLISATEQVPELHEYASARNVVLATPATLIALLKAVHFSWKQVALAESAAEVFALGRELHDRLATMGGHLDKTGRALGTAMQSYNRLVASMETRVLPTARRFRDLKVTEAQLSVPLAVEESPRVITAPELVEDAAQVEPMIGRTRRNALPEQAELTRDEPDLMAWADPPADAERHRSQGA